MTFVYRPEESKDPIERTVAVRFGGPITKEREDYLIEIHTAGGWSIEKNNEEELCFTFYEDENREWYRSYNKKTGYLVHFNGKTKINIKVMKDKKE